ncbi:GOLPH3/VPS74 family protein [Streptomyces mexicanus]|uniref:GOLPH3/VPS74 family protein n=1 Tax=Streptomyces mexicanus TaxID=178566 RepID=UPI0030176C31
MPDAADPVPPLAPSGSPLCGGSPVSGGPSLPGGEPVPGDPGDSPVPPPGLSLPARLCLLAWGFDGSGRPGPVVHRLVRAGALIELAQRGLLVDDGGIATPVDLDARTGDPVLDGLLDLVRESLPRRWRTWVTSRPRYTFVELREQLAAAGHLRVGRRRVLGVFPAANHALRSVTVAEGLRARARQVLAGPSPAAEIGERDAALAVLAAAAGLCTTAPPGRADRAGRGRRVEELIERSAARSPALCGVVREIRTALIVAADADADTDAAEARGPADDR